MKLLWVVAPTPPQRYNLNAVQLSILNISLVSDIAFMREKCYRQDNNQKIHLAMLKQKASPESVLLQEKEQESIAQLAQILSRESAQPKLVTSNGEEIILPESVCNILRQAVQAMASEQAVSIVRHNRELTTQQAANILNVSRPFLVKLLDEGAIPCIKVGSHRRIQLKDLIIYKEQRKVKRRQGLKELTQFLQEEGFYEAGIQDITQD
ncbi:helix-turn-helix domain-containing protein [Microcoleus sp. herbarium7]|uniref:helix-turn-helix domain-containing protein n=2 Tax=Microcoleus TaxID=44471 RepID=UPI002FD05724